MAAPVKQLGMKIPDVKVKYDKDRPVPPHCPKLFFIGLICGSRGSGKTHSMIQLVTMFDSTHTFDKVYVFSPTYNADPKYKLLERMDTKLKVFDDFSHAIFADVLEEVNHDLAEYKDYLEKLKAWERFMAANDPRDLDPDDVEIIEKLAFKKPTTQWKRGPPTSLMIFDDLIGNNDLYRADCKGPFNRFAIRHRHHKCALLFMTQTFQNGVPRQLRSNLSLLLLFANKNKKIAEEIAAEYSTYISVDDFAAMWNAATQEKHGFFYVDFEADEGEQLRIGFDRAFEKSVGTKQNAVQNADPANKPPKVGRSKHAGANAQAAG